MYRRTVLRGVAGLLGTAAVPKRAAAESDPDIRVDIYVADAASGAAEPVNYFAARLQSLLESVCPNKTIQVGPVGLVSVPERTQASPEAAWRWWRGQPTDPGVESNLLLVPYEWWDERSGYAGVGATNHAVSCGVEYVRGPMMGNLAIHEVGHNLGLRHSHAAEGTLMNHHVPNEPETTFSERSRRVLRR